MLCLVHIVVHHLTFSCVHYLCTATLTSSHLFSVIIIKKVRIPKQVFGSHLLVTIFSKYEALSTVLNFFNIEKYCYKLPGNDSSFPSSRYSNYILVLFQRIKGFLIQELHVFFCMFYAMTYFEHTRVGYIFTQYFYV